MTLIYDKPYPCAQTRIGCKAVQMRAVRHLMDSHGPHTPELRPRMSCTTSRAGAEPREPLGTCRPLLGAHSQVFGMFGVPFGVLITVCALFSIAVLQTPNAVHRLPHTRRKLPDTRIAQPNSRCTPDQYSNTERDRVSWQLHRQEISAMVKCRNAHLRSAPGKTGTSETRTRFLNRLHRSSITFQ